MLVEQERETPFIQLGKGEQHEPFHEQNGRVHAVHPSTELGSTLLDLTIPHPLTCGTAAACQQLGQHQQTKIPGDIPSAMHRAGINCFWQKHTWRGTGTETVSQVRI